MINAIAVDDEKIALKVIENFCKGIDFINLEKTFEKPLEAQKHLNKFPVDLVFLDINMPLLNGIALKKSLKQDTMVIFITANKDHAVEGFELNAIDYLIKPFTRERFEAAVNKAIDFYKYQHQKNTNELQYLYVRVDYSLMKIALSDILYVEALADYINIYLPDNKRVTTRLTMKAIVSKLPVKEFIRVHRSYIVPLSKIETVRNKNIYIVGKEIPIGRLYEDELFKKIKK